MSLAVLIPELEGCIRQGSAPKLTEMAERLTDLFIGGADRFAAEHIDLFGDILCRLVDQAEATTLSKSRIELRPLPMRRSASFDASPITMTSRLQGLFCAFRRACRTSISRLSRRE